MNTYFRGTDGKLHKCIVDTVYIQMAIELTKDEMAKNEKQNGYTYAGAVMAVVK